LVDEIVKVRRKRRPLVGTPLRELADGSRFVLIRTGQIHTLLRREVKASKTVYVVRRQSGVETTLHHSVRTTLYELEFK
jgi:hypothetical protein